MCYLGTARYHRLLFRVIVKQQIQFPWTSKFGSNDSICCVIDISLVLAKHFLSLFNLLSQYHGSPLSTVAVVSGSKQVTIAVVVVSLTACRRVTQYVKTCPWLNANMITMTMTSVYPCKCVHYDCR